MPAYFFCAAASMYARNCFIHSVQSKFRIGIDARTRKAQSEQPPRAHQRERSNRLQAFLHRSILPLSRDWDACNNRGTVAKLI